MVELLLRMNVARAMKLESCGCFCLRKIEALFQRNTRTSFHSSVNREARVHRINLVTLFDAFLANMYIRKRTTANCITRYGSLFALWIATYTLMDIILEIIKPSRRLCTLGYILWMVTYNASYDWSWHLFTNNTMQFQPSWKEPTNLQCSSFSSRTSPPDCSISF